MTGTDLPDSVGTPRRQGALRKAADSAWRRAGYALLPGEWFSYLLHLRPAEWPIVAAHLLVGAMLAAGEPAAFADSLVRLLPTLFAWVICLNGGTLALNSAYDRDEGDIGYLNNPPPPPAYLAPFALVAMLAGQIVVAWVSFPLALAYLCCLVLSVLYSVPPVRLKAVAGADLVVNVLGFGALTLLAGWLGVGAPLTSVAWYTAGGFAFLFAAFYPLTQIYQVSEDSARGDRTLVIVLGVRRSLLLAAPAAICAHALFLLGFLEQGSAGWLALTLLGLSLALWLGHLHRWYWGAERMGDSAHKRGMYVALYLWALTDLSVVAAHWAG